MAKCGKYTYPKAYEGKGKEKERKSLLPKKADVKNSANKWRVQNDLFDAISSTVDDFKKYESKTAKGAKCNGNISVYGRSATDLGEMGLEAGAKVSMLNGKSNSSSKMSDADYDKLKKIAEGYGLEVRDAGGRGIYTFYPKELEASEDEALKELKYEPAADSGETPGAAGITSASVGNPNSPLQAAYWVMSNLTDQNSIWKTILGEKQFAGAKPILDTITSVIESTLRDYASTPEGGLRIWWPDKWGECVNEDGEQNAVQTLVIDDMELKDLRAQFSLENVKTHVYCRGGNAPSSAGKINLGESQMWIETTGMVFLGMRGLTGGDYIDVESGPTENQIDKLLDEAHKASKAEEDTKSKISSMERKWKSKKTNQYTANARDAADYAQLKRKLEIDKKSRIAAEAAIKTARTARAESDTRDEELKQSLEKSRDWIHLDAYGMTVDQFYATFGLRPKVVNGPDLFYLSYMPFVKCLHEFLACFASIYTFSISITFMPELRPGMRIKLKSYDVSMYVDSVTHKMDYSGGFTTTMTCSCPSGTMLNAMVNYDYSHADQKDTLSDDDFKSTKSKKELKTVGSGK